MPLSKQQMDEVKQMVDTATAAVICTEDDYVCLIMDGPADRTKIIGQIESAKLSILMESLFETYDEPEWMDEYIHKSMDRDMLNEPGH